MLDALELLVEGLAVSRDLAQVALYAHELLSSSVLRVLDDALRKSHLACQLECERIARKSHLQLEERRYVLHVEHHRSVHDSRVGRGVKLEVCVVGRDDSVCASLVKLAQNRLRDCSAGCRLGS